MTEIAIYIEGGGNTAQQKSDLRQGFDRLLSAQKDIARTKRFGWKLILCGGRQAAYDAFANALERKPEIINVLLVDSETSLPLETGKKAEESDKEKADRERRNAEVRRKHLEDLGPWDLHSANPLRIHLMVQCMEAWIVSDPEALEGFYGQHFKKNQLPARPNLEEEPKPEVYSKLERATKATQKGAYGKIKHASQLLGLIDPAKVVVRCPRFATFTEWLTKTIQGI